MEIGASRLLRVASLLFGGLLSACTTGIKVGDLVAIPDGKAVMLAEELKFSVPHPVVKTVDQTMVFPRGGQLVALMRDSRGIFYQATPGVQIIISMPFERQERMLTTRYLRGGLYVPVASGDAIALWTVKDSKQPMGMKVTDEIARAGWGREQVVNGLIVDQVARTPGISLGAAAIGGALAAGIVQAAIVSGDGEIFFNEGAHALTPIKRELFD